MTPSPTDLTYFVEVAAQQNLSRAAETLGISQPSLTLAMRRLEASVGTAILTRHQHGVSLTRAGKQLLAHTRQLLQQWETIKSKTLASIHDAQGCITIGCHPSVALYSLPRFLAKLIQEHPKLDIKLQHDLSRKVTEQVINLSIDIGLAVNPVKHPDLVIQHLDDDVITLWRTDGKHTQQDLRSGEAVLLCDPDLLQTQVILKKMKKSGLHYARLIPSNNLEVIASLTKSGCGIGILPSKIAILHKLSRVPRAPSHQDEICLLYRGENRHIKAVQVIVEAIKQAFRA